MLKRGAKVLSLLVGLVFLLSVRIPAEATVRNPIQMPAKENAPTEAARDSGGGSEAPGVEMSPGQVNARSAVLLEVSTGTIIFEQNADEPIEPASFTKILTLYLVNEALKQGVVTLDDEVYISERAWRTGGSKMFVGVGTKVPLREIIKGIAVVSGNDACVAAGEHLAGSLEAFVDAMNRKSQELGMTRSRFMNPHGLPAEGQVTTARDMAKMDLEYLRRFPESLQFHSMHEYTFNDITQHNRNRLLFRDPTVDGLKTGFVSKAGYHLAATAKRDGMRLLAVVMGAPSPGAREREAMKLLNFGFRFYTLVKPFPEGEKASTVRVWKGVKDEVDLYPADEGGFLIPQASKNLLRWEVRTPNHVTAPIPAGTQLGELIFYLSDTPQRTVALVNLEELEQAGWFKRTWQSVFRLAQIDWKLFSMVAGGVLVVALLVLAIARRKSSKRSRTFGR